MRFSFDKRKSRLVKRKHGVSLEEALEIFDQVHLVDRKNDDPLQFRAIGWCRGQLCSLIYEVRHDAEGDSLHLITAWKSTTQGQAAYAENT